MALALDAAPGGLGPDRPVLGAVQCARETLAGARPERLWALSDAEVEDALTTLGQLHASVEAHLVAVVSEGRARGLGVGAGWGPQDWSRMLAPGLSTRLLADLDTIAAAAGERRLDEVREAVAAGADPEATDALPVTKAAMLTRFHRGVRALAEPQHLEDATAELLRGARGHDGMPEKTLAVALRRTGDLLRPDRLVEHEAEVRRAHRSLDKAKGPLGMWRYTLLLDDEGAAIVDSAVDALARPQKDPETGDFDPRTPGARRADALVELVRRAVSAPDGVPRQAKTSLVVTIKLDELQQMCRGAGLTLGGEPLSIETVRRLACDAQVVPAVLGTHGEILEQGRAERLFNRAQIRHLWLRDRHCTFPGCIKPATWCDAHHLLHWADGGPTDTSHGALLCQRHHTVVHANRYAGEVVEGLNGPFVKWDLAPGSYDVQLAQWRSGQPPGLPGLGDHDDGPPPP
ncbi:HNH endonuclease signature motif containing protein [Pedococcus bigeumensis]|uniref:HNH endonuclease signature motif containing protein n=1 Tax=Pedococcus bigeumensis TaxID=433644 RepID=UPI002FEC3466